MPWRESEVTHSLEKEAGLYSKSVVNLRPFVNQVRL